MRRTAETGQLQKKEMRTGAASCASTNPECGRELAVVAQQYKYLRERIDRHERVIEEGLESIRRYLKDEYAQAIDHRVAMLSARLDAAETEITAMRQSVDALTRKAIFGAGAIAVLVYLVQLAGTLMSSVWGG